MQVFIHYNTTMVYLPYIKEYAKHVYFFLEENTNVPQQLVLPSVPDRVVKHTKMHLYGTSILMLVEIS